MAVASAKAQVNVAQQQQKAAEIELNQVIPAQVTEATARRDLAQIEFDRQSKLFAHNAGSQSDVDLARTMLLRSEAELVGLAATKESKSAEVASIESRVRELLGAQAAAERDVEDCAH